MRRSIGRLASALGTTVVVLLLGGALVVRWLGRVLAITVGRLFVIVGLLVALVYAKCAVRVRRLRGRLRKSIR